MICPDCEMEVEKVGKISGICPKCQARKNNFSYYGKKYVPLKDIKGTLAYQQAMSHRLSHMQKKLNTNNVKKDDIKSNEVKNNEVKSNEVVQKEKAKDIVVNDIEDAIKRLGINTDVLNTPFSFIIESFSKMLDKSIVKDKNIMLKEYDTLIADRLHLLLQTDDYNEICRIGLEQKLIQEKRLKLKNEIKLYEPFRELIDYLLEDEVYKIKIRIALERYEEAKKELENPKYTTDTKSMEDKDFTMPSSSRTLQRSLNERKKLKKYYCAVGCYNLYGSKEKCLFELDNGLLASDEEEAKQKFKSFLKNHFESVTYYDKDIVIKEMSIQ